MSSNTSVASSPPRPPPIKYSAPLGTRWGKEKAAAGGSAAFDLPSDPKNIGPWILGECIGKGASGRVKIAKHRRTGQLAAVKILPIAPLVSSRASLATQQAKSEKQRLGIDREITMMKLMNHPNIMRIYDVYEGEKELFLVLEYVEGGELFDFLVNRGRLPPAEALAYFKQIVYGLNYAHTFSIIHRDLKPENILIASLSPPLIKIADWGMAAFAPPTLELETSCGSPHYASPEIVNGEKYQGTATDIWSCGVILYALLTGRLPFDDKNVRALLAKVKSGKYDMPSWIDPLAKDLLSRMLVVDVQKRITIPQILAHPWLKASTEAPVTGPQPKGADVELVHLPPSPSTLAQPIPSPSLIDPELFLSLRVIWGRHADSEGESIKRDLCLPPGQGIYAKAFYFLLGKYRDRTLQAEIDTDKNILQNQSEHDRSKLGWQLDVSCVNRRYDGNRNSLLVTATRSHASSPTSMPNLKPLSPSKRWNAIDGGPSFRPPSPAGPRAILKSETRRPQQQGLRVTENAGRLQSSIPGAYRPQTPTTQSLARPLPIRGHTTDLSGIPFPSRQAQRDFRRPRSVLSVCPEDSKPRTVVDKSQRPVVSADAVTPDTRCAASQTCFLPETDAKNTNIVRLKKLSDRKTERSVVRSLDPQGVAGDGHKAPSTQNSHDKENRNSGEEGWSFEKVEVSKGSVGSTVDSRSVGKETENTRRESENVVVMRAKKEKEKKLRPPTLDFRNLQQKRSTMSLLGSPVALSAPLGSFSDGNRGLASPVIGEFKGWFSNLFSWKHQATGVGGVLYSSDDVAKTRAEVGKILEGFGVSVGGKGFNQGMSREDCASCLKCRLEDLDGDSLGTLKPVRFRIEFSPSPYSTEPTTPLAQSPVLLSPPAPRSRISLVSKAAHSTPILSASAAADFPQGYASAIVLIYEKGSMSSFRAVWRRLKEVYHDSASHPCFSPVAACTPIAEQPPAFVA